METQLKTYITRIRLKAEHIKISVNLELSEKVYFPSVVEASCVPNDNKEKEIKNSIARNNDLTVLILSII